MTQPSTLVDRVVNAKLASILKSSGFRKAGRNFRRSTTTSLQIMNIQASAWNSQNSARFTVNLGAHFPCVAEVTGDPPQTAAPVHYRCHVNIRIGDLQPVGLDRWWEIAAEEDVAQIANDVSATVSNFGLPFLDSLGDAEKSCDYLRSRQFHWMACAISMSVGNLESAARDLARALQDPPRSELTDRLRQWAQSRGLEPRNLVV